jgi:hypothetical protein
MLRPAFVCQTLSSETLFGVRTRDGYDTAFAVCRPLLLWAKGNLNRRQQTEQALNEGESNA